MHVCFSRCWILFFSSFSLKSEPGKDYIRTDRTSRLRVDACATRDCLNIQIVDDTKLEDVEYFTVSLERYHGVNSNFELENLERNITITDMDSTSQAMMYIVRCVLC